MRILVAEDERATRMRLVSSLRGWGFDPVEAVDGAEAWEIFQQEEFSCVISDWIMPRMDGVELVRKIREQKRANYVYFILLTGKTETENLVEGMEAGADDFVKKPFERDELRARVGAGKRVVELERTLAERNQELSMFTSVASHDLREPLRTISSFLLLLQRQYQGKLDERADEYINFVTDAATRMSALITDLLNFARLDSRPADQEDIDTAEVYQEALTVLRGGLEECGGTVSASEPLPVVRSNRVHLGQLFQNLIGNGIKYRGEDPPAVHLEATEQDDSWLFSIKDNGIGVPAEQQEKIFEPFQRLHGVGSKYKGSGVGLAICKKVVDRLGGRIWVESEPGQGSTFFFTIPKAEKEKEEQEPSEAAP